jgi:hypothetical protein
MPPAKQAVEVVMQIAATGANGRQIAEHQQQRMAERLFTLAQRLHDLQQDLNRRGFVAMDPRRHYRSLRPWRLRQQLQHAIG